MSLHQLIQIIDLLIQQLISGLILIYGTAIFYKVVRLFLVDLQ